MSTHADTNVLMRGHVEECMNHFRNMCFQFAPKGSRAAAVIRDSVAEFCGVAPGTVSRWMYAGQMPVGGCYIKLMCFLDLVGYQIIEKERMQTPIRGLSELIGFGLLSVQGAASALGYSSTSWLEIFYPDGRDASQEKRDRMWELWKERRAELDQRKAYDRRKFQAVLRLQSHRGLERDQDAQGDSAAIRLMDDLWALLEGIDPQEFLRIHAEDLRDRITTVQKLTGYLCTLAGTLTSMGGSAP